MILKYILPRWQQHDVVYPTFHEIKTLRDYKEIGPVAGSDAKVGGE